MIVGSHLVEIYGHGRVAHLWRLMIGPTHGGKRHLCPSGAHWYAKRGGHPSVRRRVRVADHEALPLQHDGFRVVLAEAKNHAASQEEGQCQDGTGSRAARWWHHGWITEPVYTTIDPRRPEEVCGSPGPDLVPLLSSSFLPLSVMRPHSPKHPLTQTHLDSLRLRVSPPSCASLLILGGFQTVVGANPCDMRGKVEIASWGDSTDGILTPNWLSSLCVKETVRKTNRSRCFY